MHAGDLATARDYLPQVVGHYRDAGNTSFLAVGLQNLAECLGHLGQIGPARDTAAEALTCAESAGDRENIRDAHAFSGWLAGLAGDAAQAGQHFTAADQIEVADDPDGDHLYSFRGTNWAEWLARTGRPGPARALTSRNADICRDYGWNEDVARCDRMLGRLALAAGDTAAAGEHLAAAAGCFRDGDYLTELATTLADLAGHAQAAGDLEAAGRHAAEAITIAAARGLVPAHCAALAARARIRAAQATATAGPDLIYQGRDAADAALRLAVRHNLPWQELGALRAHAVSIMPRASTVDGPPKPMPGTPRWSRRAWTPTRWPPSSGSSPSRRPQSRQPPARMTVMTDGLVVDQPADRARVAEGGKVLQRTRGEPGALDDAWPS